MRAGRARGGDRRGPRRRAPADRDRRDASARPRRPRSTRSPRSPTSPSARASGSTSTPPTPGSSRCCRSGAAPFAGWERADSIVVNPHKWLFTPLDASLLLTRRMDVLRAAFSLVPEYLRTLDRDDAGPRLQRVHAAARPPVPGAQAVDPAALVRARGAAAPDRAPPRAGRGVRGAGSTPTPTGSAWRPSRSRRSASAGDPARLGRDRRRRSTTRNAAIMDAVNRTGEVFLSHTRLARPVHDPGRDRQPADRGAPRRAGLGAAPRGRARVEPVKPDAARRPVLRDARGAARLVRCQRRDRRRAVARLLQEGDRPAERRLVAGGRRGAVRRLDRQRPLAAWTTTRYAQRFTPRRKGSNWSAINVAKVAALTAEGRMRPAGLAAFEARTTRGPAVYSYERAAAAFTDDEEARFRADAAAWADWERRPPSYRRAVLGWLAGREAGGDPRTAVRGAHRGLARRAGRSSRCATGRPRPEPFAGPRAVT